MPLWRDEQGKEQQEQRIGVFPKPAVSAAILRKQNKYKKKKNPNKIQEKEKTKTAKGTALW